MAVAVVLPVESAMILTLRFLSENDGVDGIYIRLIVEKYDGGLWHLEWARLGGNKGPTRKGPLYRCNYSILQKETSDKDHNFQHIEHDHHSCLILNQSQFFESIHLLEMVSLDQVSSENGDG